MIRVFVSRRAARSLAGFAMINLIVTVAMIGTLAGLTLTGVTKSLGTIRQMRIKSEVDGMDQALRMYKQKYGAYPPCDFSNNAARRSEIKAHVARCFPKYYDISQAYTDVVKVVEATLRPDQALVFWLSGFNPDATRPFDGLDTATPLPKWQRTPPLFDFDPARLKPLGTSPGKFACSYLPPDSTTLAPYVYFDSSRYGTNFAAPPYWNAQSIAPGVGYASVYIHDADASGTFDSHVDTWANPDTFQLIAPGPDGLFGHTTLSFAAISTTQRLYPTGKGYDAAGAENDNLTNFCSYARLGDARR